MKLKYWLEKMGSTGIEISCKHGYIWVGTDKQCYGWLPENKTLAFARTIIKKFGKKKND